MIPNPCIEVQTSTRDRPSVPVWFAEVVMMARHVATEGLLEAFAYQVRLVRGHFDGQGALCLNGNHLVPISPPYSPLREYRTERETFTRIITYDRIENFIIIEWLRMSGFSTAMEEMPGMPYLGKLWDIG